MQIKVTNTNRALFRLIAALLMALALYSLSVLWTTYLREYAVADGLQECSMEGAYRQGRGL